MQSTTNPIAPPSAARERLTQFSRMLLLAAVIAVGTAPGAKADLIINRAMPTTETGNSRDVLTNGNAVAQLRDSATPGAAPQTARIELFLGAGLCALAQIRRKTPKR